MALSEGSRSDGITRRQLLLAGVVGVGALALSTPSRIPDVDGENSAEAEEDATFLRNLRQQPLATVTRLKQVPPGDESLVLLNTSEGIPVAETLRHLHDNGNIAKWTAENTSRAAEHETAFFNQTDPEEDITPFTASGFVTADENGSCVVSNRHVLSLTARRLEDLMTFHTRRDIAATPGELVQRCAQDPYDLPFVTISKRSNDATDGRNVVIQGMGQRMLRVEGPTILLRRSPPNKDGIDCTGEFGLAVSFKDLKQHEAAGLSGSRVEDAETGETLGVFHSVITIEGLDDRFLMLFSGPEDVRETLAEADRKRRRDQTRYNLDALFNRKPAGADVSPPPAP